MQTSFFGPPDIKSDLCDLVNLFSITVKTSFFYDFLFFCPKTHLLSYLAQVLSARNTIGKARQDLMGTVFCIGF